MNKVNVNEQVSITNMGFKKDLAPYPRRMEFRGTVYEFIDAGLRCLIRQGDRIAEVITVSDGQSYFRLHHENQGGNWTLLSIQS